MSHSQHHEKRSSPSESAPHRTSSRQDLASSNILSQAHSQSVGAYSAELSPGMETTAGGRGVPLSSLLRETSLQTASDRAELVGTSDTSRSHRENLPASSTSDSEQTSPTRRAYFDPAREPGLVYPPALGADLPFSPRASLPSRFRLQIIQQPIAARACGHGERDRRVVDPPPILQLSLANFDPKSESDRAELQHSHNVVHCKLFSANNPPRDVSTIADPTDRSRVIRSLMGTASSTPFVGVDPALPTSIPEEQRLGVFYIFHDISCRHTGKYRLYFELASLSMDVGVTRGVVASVMSDVFEVHSAKDFPGMRPSSELSHELKRQGANLPIKKGVEVKGGRRTRKSGDNESGESSGDGR